MRAALHVAILGSAVAAASARAAVVEVMIRGEVEFNQIGAPPLGDANPGDPVAINFIVDSENFVDSPNFPTRGYVIDPASVVITLGAASIGLQEPFPAGQTPYFVIRNDDPAVDGFLLSTNFRFPVGVPLDQVGVFGNFIQDFSVTYTGDTLESLDILSAQGVYDFTNLTVYGFNIEDGGFKPLGIQFQDLTIGVQTVPTLSEWGLLAMAALTLAAGTLVMRRRLMAVRV